MTKAIIQVKANELFDKDEKELFPGFTFSNGWFERLKGRHSLMFKKPYGSAGLVDKESMGEQLVRVRETMSRYNLNDIYNFDETGLFYKLLPPKSHCLKEFKGFKEDKNRITVALMCVMLLGPICYFPLL